MNRPRGTTLVEMLVGALAAGILLGAGAALLTVGRRAAWEQVARSRVAAAVDVSASVLRAELIGIAGALGDLAAASESSITLRALRGAGSVCAPIAAGAQDLVLHAGRFRAWRAMDPARDSIHVWRDGSPFTRDDDRWVLAAVAGTGTRPCADGEPGLALRTTAPAAALDGVRPGAPVRAWEVVQYRVYADATGERWFGVRTPSAGGGWSPSSPIAGPLQAGGLTLGFQDAGGMATAAPESAAAIRVRVQAVSPGPVARPGGSPMRLRDSVVTVVRPGER